MCTNVCWLLNGVETGDSRILTNLIKLLLTPVFKISYWLQIWSSSKKTLRICQSLPLGIWHKKLSQRQVFNEELTNMVQFVVLNFFIFQWMFYIRDFFICLFDQTPPPLWCYPIPLIASVFFFHNIVFLLQSFYLLTFRSVSLIWRCSSE